MSLTAPRPRPSETHVNYRIKKNRGDRGRENVKDRTFKKFVEEIKKYREMKKAVDPMYSRAEPLVERALARAAKRNAPKSKIVRP